MATRTQICTHRTLFYAEQTDDTFENNSAQQDPMTFQLQGRLHSRTAAPNPANQTEDITNAREELL